MKKTLASGGFTVRTADGEFSVRPGRAEDVPAVTSLIHDAFSIWAGQGLRLRPMSQTEEETARHLVGGGFVARNSKGAIVGTFSLADGAEIDYAAYGAVVPRGRLLVFKKAAVARAAANAGLGSELYAAAERLARGRGRAGMILETVEEAGWLYGWYRRLGFKPVGRRRYPGAQVDTVLMIKLFGRRAKAA